MVSSVLYADSVRPLGYVPGIVGEAEPLVLQERLMRSATRSILDWISLGWLNSTQAR